MVLAVIAERWVLRMAYKKHIFDSHNARKIHRGDVPRLGGIIFFPVSTIAVLLSSIVAMRLFNYTVLPGDLSEILGLIGAMFIMFMFGMFDDFRDVRYRAKFVSQIVAGLLLCVSGLWLKDLHGLFGIHALSPWVGWPLTIFAIIFVINAVNFIDGIDGLAGTTCLFGLSYYAYFNYMTANSLMFLLSVTLIGCVLPYLYFNLFGTSKGHTKVFMGDTGSTILGVVMVSFGMMVNNSLPSDNAVNPMMLGFAPLVYPCYDTVRVVLHRLRNHRNPFKADMNHFHHKLLAVGFSQRATLLIINCISISFIILMTLSCLFIDVTLVLLLSLLLWMAINIVITRRMKTKNTIENEEN